MTRVLSFVLSFVLTCLRLVLCCVVLSCRAVSWRVVSCDALCCLVLWWSCPLSFLLSSLVLSCCVVEILSRVSSHVSCLAFAFVYVAFVVSCCVLCSSFVSSLPLICFVLYDGIYTFSSPKATGCREADNLLFPKHKR